MPDMPAVSKLWSKLYQGSRPPAGDVLRRMHFDTVVLCAVEYQPRTKDFPGVEVLRIQLDDQAELPSSSMMRAVGRLAELVAYRVERAQRVLVTCNMGINRSGLVSAVSIMKLTGCSGSEAIAAVQAGRPGSLRNPYFAEAIRRLLPGGKIPQGARPAVAPEYQPRGWRPARSEVDDAPWLRPDQPAPWHHGSPFAAPPVAPPAPVQMPLPFPPPPRSKEQQEQAEFMAWYEKMRAHREGR